MKQIIDQFNKLNDQARYAIVVVVIFLFILVDVLLLVLPQMSGISNVNDQIKKISDDTQDILANRGRIDFLKRNLQNSRLQLDSLSNKVRALQEVPAILSTISSIANEYGVKIDQLVPKKGSQTVVISTPEAKYYALPVEIKARCGYHKFGYFLNQLENSNLYFVMKDFIIQNDANDAHARLYSLTINLILVDHSLKTP